MKALKARLKSLPADRLAANQPFAIRLHRAISWMERAGKQDDVDSRFIYAWIAFNALYGQAREGLPSARSQGRFGGGDRNEYVDFLNKLARLDPEPLLSAVMPLRRYVTDLVACKYLHFCFWRQTPDCTEMLGKDVDALGRAIQSRNIGHILSLVFDRLYTLRLQLFHGGATFGSRVNRSSVRLAELVISRLLPVIIEAMIDRGIDEDWGDVAYPPVDQPTYRPERSSRHGT